ncbi:RnfH family protein [Caldimonas tepidiphila]|uniref:RnfH family protein n=1 Tax=Caldimonas tepidiphila TaxID=2315841 RepID=UPI000E5B3E2B|nr:RnfH family protein [Caldimonas tepidiphila]
MAAAELSVEVVYSARPGELDRVPLRLAEGSTVLHALRASGLLERHPEIDPGSQPVGVWGRKCPLSQGLRDRDRVELYRPLTVDPKEARRLRYRSQRERSPKRP